AISYCVITPHVKRIAKPVSYSVFDFLFRSDLIGRGLEHERLRVFNIFTLAHRDYFGPYLRLLFIKEVGLFAVIVEVGDLFQGRAFYVVEDNTPIPERFAFTVECRDNSGVYLDIITAARRVTVRVGSIHTHSWKIAGPERIVVIIGRCIRRTTIRMGMPRRGGR